MELFRACSAHSLSERPPPDLDRHSDIADPDARLRVVLRELYTWYWQNQRIVGHVVGDAATMPALAESLADLADARARNGRARRTATTCAKPRNCREIVLAHPRTRFAP